MSLPKLNSNLNIISSLPDKPTQSAIDLKSKWDEAPNIIKDYLNNDLLPSIESMDIPLVNDLTTGGTKSCLSAEMGKQLEQTKQSKINYGVEVPTLKEGEIFIQVFE